MPMKSNISVHCCPELYSQGENC